MDGWSAQIDIYCERTEFTYWAEPVNALSNVAFLIGAAVMMRRLRGARLPLGWALAWTMVAIGVGSYLFHTHATRWASALDVGAIAVYILIYIYAANRAYWRLRPLWAGLGAAAFVPWVAATGPIFDALPFFGISNAYWSVASLIALYAVALWRRAPATARGLALGALALAVSISLRSVDMAVCATVPVGTHVAWHLINGAMLAWMIEVYRRHALAAAGGLH